MTRSSLPDTSRCSAREHLTNRVTRRVSLARPFESIRKLAPTWRLHDVVDIPTHRSLASIFVACRGRVHDRHGSHDRQHRAAHDRTKAALLANQPDVGGDRLRADLRRLSAARRMGGRPTRAPPRDHRRPCRVHRSFTRSLAGRQRGGPDRDARRPGSRRGDVPPRRPVDNSEHVHRRRRAQQSARHLGSTRGPGRDRRARVRRHPDPVRRMAVHLLAERPGRHGRAGACPAGGARDPPRGYATTI